jgi:hypothetical protein
MAASCRPTSSTEACRHSGLQSLEFECPVQSMRPANGGPFVHMTPWIPCDGRSPCPAFRASRSRLLAEPSLGELQPCDIDVNPTCAESHPDNRQINALARKLALHFGAGEDQALCSRAGKYCSARRIRFGRTIPRRLRRAACAGSGWVTQRRRIWPCAAVGRTTSWD